MKIIQIPIQKIKPYHRNVRHNDKTVDKLVEIIPKVGFNVPLVIDKNNIIVKGHSRWRAAIILGLEELPCIISDKSDDLNNLDRLTDNKIQEFSTWDDDLLRTEIAALNLDIDLGKFGFDLGFEPVVFDDKYEDNPDVTPKISEPSYQTCICSKCGNVMKIKK